MENQYKERKVPSLERDYRVFSMVIFLILILFCLTIGGQIYRSQNIQRVEELNVKVKTIENSLEGTFTNISQFLQFLGDKVLQIEEKNSQVIPSLFKRYTSIDSDLSSFYSWSQLSWVAKESSADGESSSNSLFAYPLEAARNNPWILYIGKLRHRERDAFYPIAMGIADDNNKYKGSIISEVPVEMLQRSIKRVIGEDNNFYEYGIFTEKIKVLFSSNNSLEKFVDANYFRNVTSSNDVEIRTFIDSEKLAIYRQYQWGEHSFLIYLKHKEALLRQKFLTTLYPYIFVSGLITTIFLLVLYVFRGKIILPVIKNLKENLAQETSARLENERLLAQILGSIPSFLYRHKLSGDHIIAEFVSQGSYELTGYKNYQYFGERPIRHTDVIHPKFAQKVVSHISSSLKKGQAFEISYPIITAEGKEKWVLNQGNIVNQTINNEKKEIQFEGLLTDITEIKNTERKMEKTLKELEVSNFELERFAHACSHDLKEPLRSVYSYIQLFKSERDNEYLKYAEEGALRMKSLIENILLYSQLGVVNQIQQKRVDLNNVLTTALSCLQAVVDETGAKIHVTKLGEVKGDFEQLVRVFQNLIANALKYVSSKQTVVYIESCADNEYLQFLIRDNGIGISKEYHEKVFQLFERLHSKDSYSGSGIGLALCQKIIERHGGKIWVESEEGKGATFIVQLPLYAHGNTIELQ